MTASKTIRPRWGVAAPACSVLGCLTLLLLFAVDPSANAGVGGGAAVLLVCSASAVLCLTGVVVGLAVVWRDRRQGHGWAGIAVGLLPLVGLLLWAHPELLHGRFGNGDYIVPE